MPFEADQIAINADTEINPMPLFAYKSLMIEVAILRNVLGINGKIVLMRKSSVIGVYWSNVSKSIINGKKDKTKKNELWAEKAPI